MIVVLMVVAVFIYGAHAKKDVYGAFLEGAGEGLQTAVGVAPYLGAALLMIGMLRASGLLSLLEAALAPALGAVGIPRQLLALLFIRPLSGAAALAEIDSIMAAYGADSYTARAACAMMGSSETVLYTIGLYLGSANIEKSRYILPIGLFSSVFGAVVACFLCKIM